MPVLRADAQGGQEAGLDAAWPSSLVSERIVDADVTGICRRPRQVAGDMSQKSKNSDMSGWRGIDVHIGKVQPFQGW
jgi:hypothetical protein